MNIINKTAEGVATGAREYLTFRLGEEEYGIDILKVQEIRGYEQPTRIANAPEFIKGVVNLRGTIVPIVDMRLRFNCSEVEYNAFTVVIILNLRNRVVGIVVDSVSDVMGGRRCRASCARYRKRHRQRLHPGPGLGGRAHADPAGHREAHGQCRHGPGGLRSLSAPEVCVLNLGRNASFAASPARPEQDEEALPGGMSGPLAQGREFVWSNRDFARVQTLIYKRAGISLHDGKHAMVYSRLSRRLRETGHELCQLSGLAGEHQRRA